MSQLHPIFVVGVPRSGTTLLASLLGRHSRLACGPETHFFTGLNRIPDQEILRDWPGHAIELMATRLKHYAGHAIDDYRVAQDALHAALEKQEPSLANMLECLIRLGLGLPRGHAWVEKTPGHLRHVDRIRKWFPRSPIIRIVRDPRAVAGSLRRVPWSSTSIYDNASRWRRELEGSSEFFRCDENSMTVHYEHLVRRPEDALRGVLDQVPIRFERQMLEPDVGTDRMIAEGEWWKEGVGERINASLAKKWRTELTERQIFLAEVAAGSTLRTFGYEHYRFNRLRYAFLTRHPFPRYIVRQTGLCRLLERSG